MQKLNDSDKSNVNINNKRKIVKLPEKNIFMMWIEGGKINSDFVAKQIKGKL